MTLLRNFAPFILEDFPFTIPRYPAVARRVVQRTRTTREILFSELNDDGYAKLEELRPCTYFLHAP